MPLQLLASIPQIRHAINSFPAVYHGDYFSTRIAASAHLSEPTLATAGSLAAVLRKSLLNWGAGKRGAPHVQTIANIVAFLLSTRFASVQSLSRTDLSGFRVTLEGRTFAHPAGATTPPTFDSSLISALSDLSSGVLVGNTSITYPMKALLLITGLTPALDSQVRNGLSQVGFRGTRKTQFLLPADSTSTDARKITRLPFFLGQCLFQHGATLYTAVAGSAYPTLAAEPGRLFDVLFFMQSTSQAPMFHLAPSGSPWYSIQ